MEAFAHLRVPLKIIMHATKNFGAGNFIAGGGFGKVYRGEFSNTVGAVKLFDRSIDKADVSFMTEIMFLTSCSHENLISLIGFCDEDEKRILVYEYAGNKSLDFHLTGANLKWTQRLKICVGAACGLQYLHDPKGTQQRIIHRDIKSGNILLDENWNAKIADFGLSRHGPANQDRTFVFSEAKGTLGYCDPMYVEDMLLTKESDVYSFGVVLFEVLCSRCCVDRRYNDERRSLPILVKKCHQEERLHTIIDVNLRTQMDKDCFDTFVKIALQCLERERKRRPKMESVVSKLKIALQFQESSDQRRIRYSPKLEEIQNAILEFGLVGGRYSVVLYTTTLQFIQKTFTDCSNIRSILNSYNIVYEERDVSLFSGFREQLRKTLGRNMIPPRLFIDGCYIGGAEQVLCLHEEGNLRGLLAKTPQNTSKGKPCKGCDGVRFVTCRNCRGTRSDGHFTCKECDEKGLVFCYICKFASEIG